MLTLYTAPTPNGWKASIALEELGLPYEVRAVDLHLSEQKTPEFLALNPNGRIPVLVDDGFAIFESGAILVWLAEKAGRLLPAEARARSEVLQWVFFQVGGLGPMMGQANVFYRYAPEKIPFAIERYQRESRRLLEVLDARLAAREFLCGAYSIADIMHWSWAHTHRWSGVDVSGLPHLDRWLHAVGGRPAVQRGKAVPVKVALKPEDEKLFAEKARGLLV